MEVLSQRYLGFLHSCIECGALLKYEPTDIYDGYLYCPLCKTKQKCALQVGYDGVVRAEVKEDEAEGIVNGQNYQKCSRY